MFYFLRFLPHMPLPGRLLRSRLARLASFLEAPCCRLAPDAHKSHTPTPRNQRSGGPFSGLKLCGGVEASSARGLAVLELPDPSAACCLSGFAVVLLRRAMQNALPQQAYLSFRGNHLGLAGSCCDVFLLGSSPFLKSHFGDFALQAGRRSENSTQPAKTSRVFWRSRAGAHRHLTITPFHPPRALRGRSFVHGGCRRFRTGSFATLLLLRRGRSAPGPQQDPSRKTYTGHALFSPISSAHAPAWTAPSKPSCSPRLLS